MISLSILFRMRHVLDKSYRENQNTHFMYNNVFPKIVSLWGNVEKHGRARQATGGNIIRRMRFACWITKATDTHLEYVILIAFPRQQWLRECSSMLRLYVQCLSCLIFSVFYSRCFPPPPPQRMMLKRNYGHKGEMHAIANRSNSCSCLQSRSSSQALSFYLCSHISSYLLSVTRSVGCYMNRPFRNSYQSLWSVFTSFSLIRLFAYNTVLPSASVCYVFVQLLKNFIPKGNMKCSLTLFLSHAAFSRRSASRRWPRR
jgi:hypothetical protein